MGEWDRLRGDFVRGETFDFLRANGFVRETEQLRAFIDKHRLDDLKRGDPLTALRRLSETIYQSFDYEAGVTGADSPIDQALSAGRGVCQDFAHIMIAICRGWGVPARYVSGYLFTDRKAGDRSDPDATHAWVEVFLPSLRWVGFDPTNNAMAGERHVVVACGRDYSDVPPSRGVYKGDAESQLGVAVSVRRARAAMSEPEFLRISQPAFTGAARRRQSASAALEAQQRQQQQQQQQ
jgi:transglutaminase-like putative cysteine protease